MVTVTATTIQPQQSRGEPTAEGATARTIRIAGGAPLRGDVTMGGAKNAALPALAATLLTADECVLNNVPNLADIATMSELLRTLGAEVELDLGRHRVRVRAAKLTSTSAPPV